MWGSLVFQQIPEFETDKSPLQHRETNPRLTQRPQSSPKLRNLSSPKISYANHFPLKWGLGILAFKRELERAARGRRAET